MSLPDALDLLEHWSNEPTVGMMLRAFFGVSQRRKQPLEMKNFARELPGAAGEARSIKKARPHLAAMMEKAKAEKSA